MSDMIPTWFETGLSDEELAYELDKAAGMAPTREEMRPAPRTPVRLSRQEFNDFAADEMRQWKDARIREIRNRNLRGR